MQITDVRIRKVEKEGKMKAVVSITIDEEFVVHDIKIIEGEKGRQGIVHRNAEQKGRGRGIPRHRSSDQFGHKRADTDSDPSEIPGDNGC